MIRLLLVLIIVLLVSACVPQYTLVSPGPQQVGAISVNTNNSWNQAPATHTSLINGVVWTADGMPLDRLIFFSGIEEGGSLFKGRNSKEPLPVFRNDMLPHEIMEMVVDSLTKFMGQQSVIMEAENLAPRMYGDTQGFRFDLSYTNADGLSSKGMVAAVIKERKLYLILFSAAELHYYGKYAGEVESIMSSANFGKGSK
jgi:hypothetical protein